MLYITVCLLALLAAADVHGRYLYESTIHGSIETNKILSNWEDALAQCKTEGAVLAAPLNKQLRDKMIDLIAVNNHSTPYFINAKIVNSSKSQFMSSEGVSLDDMSVSDMIDELDPREGDCLAMDAHTIRVVSCSMPLPYMCYKENDTITSITEQNSDCGTDDKEYSLNNSTGSCYKLHREERSWDDAKSVCLAEGGYLVILNDGNEASVIRDMPFIRNQTKEYCVYIGIRDFSEDDEWMSVHGDKMDKLYNDWADNYDQFLGEFCGIFPFEGTLFYSACDDKYAFVCEKDPRGKH